jgi:AcrR family transcriptional regulator
VTLQTALAIVDRYGVDGLPMRRFSNAVGRDPVMLYRHVPNNAAVLDGVAEIVLAQLLVDNTDPDWAGQLRTVAHFRRLALAHPNVVPLLVTRPLATPLGQRPPGMLRPLEDVLALLTCAGFTGDDALHIYRMLFGFLYGHILDELEEVIERAEEPTTCSGSVCTGSRQVSLASWSATPAYSPTGTWRVSATPRGMCRRPADPLARGLAI